MAGLARAFVSSLRAMGGVFVGTGALCLGEKIMTGVAERREPFGERAGFSHKEEQTSAVKKFGVADA